MLRRWRPLVCSIANVSSLGAQHPTGRAACVGCTASANSTASLSPRPSAPSPAPRTESRPAHRRQSGSAPQARPRETTHATAVSCRRRGIKPSPPLRSLSHHPTTPAHWPADPIDAPPPRPAPGRSGQLDPLAKENLPESCIEQNPQAIVTREWLVLPRVDVLSPLFDEPAQF